MSEETPIEQAINSGVKNVTVDGASTTFQDLKELRKQKRLNDANQNKRRPVVSTIDLSGS